MNVHMMCCAYMYMYVQVENLLLSSSGVIKLCDFGSATTQHISPDNSWSATQRGLVDEEVSMGIQYTYILKPQSLKEIVLHPADKGQK